MAGKSRGKSADHAGQTDREPQLANALRAALTESLLPGEALTASRLDDAVTFLLEAADRREEGNASLLIRSAAQGQRCLRLAVINRNMPFLVDSIASTISAHGLSIDLLLHPVVAVRRDAEGRLSDLLDDDSAGEKLESMIYIETTRIDAKERRALERDLITTLADVRAAVSDWPKMRMLMSGEAERVADPEGAALLRWLADGMLTLLGHVTRKRDGGHAQVLGICRKSARELVTDETYERAFAWFEAHPGKAPLIIKANRLSRVHRSVPLDLFIVPLLDGTRLSGVSVFAGIWTSAALAAPPDEVPVLRRQLATMMERLDFSSGGHDAKALVHALTALPHDVVIGFSERDITRVASAMIGIVDRPRPKVALVTAPLGRHLFAFVWLPRDLHSTDTRLEIEALLEQETGAQVLDWNLLIEGGNLATLRYVLDIRNAAAKPDAEALDRQLQTLLRGWRDAVESALTESEEPGRAAALAARFAPAFPSEYRGTYGAAEAARDIGRLRLLSSDGVAAGIRDARLYRPDGDPGGEFRLKIYQRSGWLPLSDAVPALENFGFHVLSEESTELASAEGTIHDFRLSLPPGESVDQLLDRAAVIEQAISAVLNGQADSDPFNRLVVGTALTAQEAEWLRAFYRYIHQANAAFTVRTAVDALRAAPLVTRSLIELFRAQHDPQHAGDREKSAEAAEQNLRSGLTGVTAINDDRLLRLYQACIAAVLRTNAFLPSGAEALAFKFDSAKIPGLPRPVPWREIFVYSRRIEGIHLRAGPVARGGIRWSDRRDDFRTEVLGLMKAQRVKNAIIVPTGAKGGFYPKRLPDPQVDRDAWFAEGRESYCVFIRALLSLTDNIVADKVVHPEGMVIHDEDDPYFVVAADKGTASFSDTANALALERGFWLGDAFASGGSRGYDHKAMGITARGAWISVQRHFLEMGVDVQTEPVRVAGCGDMSGDVFGNGMLLSKSLKLVAAFDHRHIFIDPDPDPQASWTERKRLFETPRSSWADYNEALISKGGGVYPRTMKSIPLSPEARATLGVEEAELDPDSVISAILRSEVDLFWFGGIGTYIKAAQESDADVGDPANDALRVDGLEVRAKVIGEGANLGVTQAGRIEFALREGRINTDFIDNSAGVDCSDNEVNIKIALAPAQRSGRLSEAKRVSLLRKMTDEVAALVLEDNRLQALALSVAEAAGSQSLAAHLRLIEALEDTGELDRRTAGLADAETLARRSVDAAGLTRPELAVLLSSAKLALQDAVEASDLSQDQAAEPLLLSDFPPQMRRTYRKEILSHPLRREIVATVVANKMVNRMGLVHPFELTEEGVGLGQVAASFVSACELLGMDAIWSSIDAAEMPEQARIMLFEQAALALRGHMADLLRSGGAAASPSALIGEVNDAVADLMDHVDDLLAAEAREHYAAILSDLANAGAPSDLAQTVGRLFAVDGAIGLARLAASSNIKVGDLARAFIELGEILGLDWAQARAAVMNPSDPWERLLVASLARDFQQMRYEFLRTFSADKRSRKSPALLVGEWAAEHGSAIGRFRAMVGRAQTASPLTPAMLAQIAGQARTLLQLRPANALPKALPKALP